MKEPRRTSRSKPMSRRTLLKSAAGLAAGAAIVGPRITEAAGREEFYKIKNKRINQSVVAWCFKPMPIEELAMNAAKMGMKSVELAPPESWNVLKKYGLICAISSSHGFLKGFAHEEEHAECTEKLRSVIDATSAAGFPNVITFSGMRRGLPEDVGLKNMVKGMRNIVGYAEKKKVTICLEMLNSRVDQEMRGHPDYMCDKLEWAVEVCKQVNSERMKILFDIYHVQIMQGDIIRYIRKYYPYIGHYHTAGNPGRNEIDDTQEINYAPIMKVILETGYKGYVGQEFIPIRDKVASLNQAVKICDV
jgi:hydroxypyruvate isomerase